MLQGGMGQGREEGQQKVRGQQASEEVKCEEEEQEEKKAQDEEGRRRKRCFLGFSCQQFSHL